MLQSYDVMHSLEQITSKRIIGYDFNLSAQHLDEARDNVYTPSSPKRVNSIS